MFDNQLILTTYTYRYLNLSLKIYKYTIGLTRDTQIGKLR